MKNAVRTALAHVVVTGSLPKGIHSTTYGAARSLCIPSPDRPRRLFEVAGASIEEAKKAKLFRAFEALVDAAAVAGFALTRVERGRRRARLEVFFSDHEKTPLTLEATVDGDGWISLSVLWKGVDFRQAEELAELVAQAVAKVEAMRDERVAALLPPAREEAEETDEDYADRLAEDPDEIADREAAFAEPELSEDEKKAREHEAEARRHDAERQRSREESDADGFLSQWASGISREKETLAAKIARAGGRASFVGLWEGDRRVAARVVDGRFGKSWLLREEEAERFGRRFLPTGRRSRVQKELGLSERRELAPAEAAIKGSGTGLSGSVWTAAQRTGDLWGLDSELEVELEAAEA